jgi:hypothetical protein
LGLPQAETLPNLPFEVIWSRAASAVGRLALGRLQLSVYQAGQLTLEHGWANSGEQVDVVAFEIRAGSPQDTLCHLRLETGDSHSLADGRMLLLLSGLRQIVRYWAAHPETLADAGVRVFGKIPQLAAAGDARTKRAA